MDFRVVLILLGSTSVLAFPRPGHPDFDDRDNERMFPLAENDDTSDESMSDDDLKEQLSLNSRREPATLGTVRRLAERRYAQALEAKTGGVPPLGAVPWKPAKSCQEILDDWPYLPSGLYYIYYKKGRRVQVFRTYCQMTIADGGWTFIPRQAVIKGSVNRGLIKQLFTKTDEVLLVIHQPGYKKKQRYTRIRQLAEYSHIPLSLTMNEHDSSPRPASVDMGPYIYLRVLPPSEAQKKTWLGFQVNGQDAKYHNCYGRRSNYWALYPNDKNVHPKAHINKHCNTQPCVKWITTGFPMYGAQEVPNDMLFYAEMHFGQNGRCGVEQVSDGGWIAYTLGIAVR